MTLVKNRKIKKGTTIKVNDVLNMLSYSTQYELIGAKTGKKLYKSWRNTNIDKYKDLDVTPGHSIELSFRIYTNSMGTVESVCSPNPFDICNRLIK